MNRVVGLVVAKAPVPGRVKTRLAAVEGHVVAAGLARAALLDTLDACERAFGAGRCHLALDTDPASVTDEELLARLATWTVHRQRGTGLARRLENAHRSVHQATGSPVVQLGMDTPHVSPDVLREVAETVATGRPVLGPAEDGGWWVLATSSADQVVGLGDVPMSTPGTARATWALLEPSGVVAAPLMRDVDDAADAECVAALAPGTRFAHAWRTRGA